MQTKEQILELRYNRLANTNQSTPWNKVPTIYKTIALEAMELYASQRQGGMRWVNGLPVDGKEGDRKNIKYCGNFTTIVFFKGSWSWYNWESSIQKPIPNFCKKYIQYLDESEASPTSQPAQVNKKLISDCIACITDASNRLDLYTNFDFAEQAHYLLEQLKEVKLLVVEPSTVPAEGPCAHDAVIDSGTGYHYCKQCNRAWTIEEWRRGQHPPPEPVAAQGVEEAARYVAGFFFDTSCDNVWLIKKNKPKWQKGLLNGIGGKIEPGETSAQAMMREFIEETGHNPYGIWKQFCTLKGKDWSVDFYYVVAEEMQEFEKPYTTTDEEVIKVSISELHDYATISNLTWLIQLACDTEIYGIDYNISAGASFIQSQHPSQAKQAIKTLRKFEKSGKGLDEFISPLDRIDWFLYEHILCGFVAPSFDNGKLGQAGEAESKVDGVLTYMTVMRVGDKYYYLGILPAFQQAEG